MELLAIILGGFVGYLGVKNYKLQQNEKIYQQKIDLLEFKNALNEGRIELHEFIKEMHQTDAVYWKNEYLKIKKISQN